jgi:hypothetical protein
MCHNKEILNFKKLIDVEGQENYRVKISNRFADLANKYDDVDINGSWENNFSQRECRLLRIEAT